MKTEVQRKRSTNGKQRLRCHRDVEKKERGMLGEEERGRQERN